LNAILFVFLIIFSGCEISPLLNHTYNEFAQAKKRISSSTHFVGSLNLNIEFDWPKGPNGNPNLESQLQLIFRDDEGKLTNLPATHSLFVYGWMPSMGHGTADDGELIQTGMGTYLIKDFYFSMPGEWDIFIQILKNNVVDEEIKISVTVPESTP